MTIHTMNHNLLPDLDVKPLCANTLEDQRNLQIALELSNLRLLSGNEDASSTSSLDDVTRGKKSQNMTECVPVPSSEHVAEIVGRQGCKIKALRQRTNTYIKTPVRGEEPVFVVTGRKEDVATARREVQSAAEHFTQIRASRNRHALLASQAFGGSEEGATGTITLQVRVPYRVVGLVVGPKGATIKRIQQQTHTYIVTPSREKEPVFEVTGLPENVEKAKEEIEAHIAARTGAQHSSIDDDFKSNGVEVGSPSVNEFMRPGFSAAPTAYRAASYSTSACLPYNGAVSNSVLRTAAPSFIPSASSTASSGLQAIKPVTFDQPFPSFPSTYGAGFRTAESARGPTTQWSTGNSFDTSASQYPFNRSNSVASGLSSTGFSPTSSLPPIAGLHRLSPTSSEEMCSFKTNLHAAVKRVGSEESTTSSIPSLEFNSATSGFYRSPAITIESGYYSGTPESSASGSPRDLQLESTIGAILGCSAASLKQCMLCNSKSVSAALVPCGHNLFCMECALALVTKSPALCPCCQRPATMALQIKK